MIDAGAIESAMGSLAAAVTARRLYGSDHPAARSAAAQALSGLHAVLTDTDSVAVHEVEGRIIGPSGTLANSDVVRAAVFLAVSASGVRSIRISRGVTPSECTSLIAVLSGEAEVASLSPGRVLLGSAECGAGDGRPTAGFNPRSVQAAAAGANRAGDLVQAYRSSPAVGSDALQPSKLDEVAAGVCAAVMNARGTMLEIASLKAYDEYTFVHTVNVALLSAALAETCGLSPRHVHEITLAALLHDVGKRVLPASILGKQAPLDDQERRTMQRHPVEGGRILVGQSGVPEVAAIVAFEHHMHIDGTGYPERPTGWRPHLAAQIVQQADVFDALRTNRPYRAAMPADKAAAILREGAGTKYDRELVELFIGRVASRSTRDAA